MKRIIPIFLFLLALTACDSKRDTNGNLGGMWQLTLWTNAEGDTLATNQQEIYYSFHQDLMKLNRKDGEGLSGEVLLRFQHAEATLQLTRAYLRPQENEIPLDTLLRYGVPADGHFHVDGLSSSRMQLSGQTGTLWFRKY